MIHNPYHGLSSRMVAILICVLFTIFAIHGQGRVVSGVVVDSVSHEPIPYARVLLKSAKSGKLTDEKGWFVLSSVVGTDSLVVSAMGYGKVVIPATGAERLITLPPVGVKMGEIIVRPKKEKYSKRNNPAVDFVGRIRANFETTNPRNNDYLGFDKHERINIALNDISAESTKNLILKGFDFLREYIDTSEVSGKPILNISDRDKLSRIYYRRNPNAEKEVIEGLRQGGLDDFMDQDNMRVLYEDFFSDIDLFQNDIYLLHTKFVSPLSKIGPDFYKYYLTDTLDIDGEKCIELTFAPHNSASTGFVGKIYVPAQDSTMFIKKVVMTVPHNINVNFIDKINIVQTYAKGPSGERFLVSDDLMAEINIVKGTQGLYVRRRTEYDNYTTEPAEDTSVYEIGGRSMLAAEANNRDEQFWKDNSIIAYRPDSKMASNVAKALRKSPWYFWGEKIVKIFAVGYIGTSTAGSKFDIGPINTFVSHNSVEGWRLRFGGMTTANISKRVFARGYGAYGIRDHRWKYGAELEYSFNDKTYHSREFPIRAIRLSHKYDVDMLGQHYAFANADNMFLSFKRKEDFQMTYLRQSKIEYIYETDNHLSVNAALHNYRQRSTPYMTFVDGYGRNYSHYDETGVELTLRYAPGERYYQTKSGRKSISPEMPVFELSHRYSPRLFGNPFEINRTEARVAKRFWFSAFGSLDALLKGGHIWSRVPYPSLLIPNANLSYTIQPESFSCMNPMEFMTDSYLQWDMVYYANGAILNYIPYVKKLKLREVFSFRGVWGHLSRKNRPDLNPELYRFPEIAECGMLGTMPYMEASVGLDNLFRILQVEYVWRLTYRNRPNINRSGVRIALHFSF